MNYLPTCTSRVVVQHLYQVSFKSMQGCRRSWEDKLWCDGRTEWRKAGRTEGRKDGMTDKANTKCPLAILWRVHNKELWEINHYNPEGKRHSHPCIHECNIQSSKKSVIASGVDHYVGLDLLLHYNIYFWLLVRNHSTEFNESKQIAST